MKRPPLGHRQAIEFLSLSHCRFELGMDERANGRLAQLDAPDA
jgi:hypothetical protein